MQNRLRGFAAVGAGVFCATGWTGPTSLNFIPIAEVLKHREVHLELNSAVIEHQIDPTVYHALAIQAGLFDRIEFGIDLGLDPKAHAIWNAKVLLGGTRDGKAAFGAGLWNCDDDYVEPYAVASHDLSWARWHLGFSHDEVTRLIAGADGLISKHFNWMADFMGGTREQIWLGLGFSHPAVNGLGVSLSLGVPLNRSQGWQGSLAIGYARPL